MPFVIPLQGQHDQFNVKDTEANTVFLPPKTIDKCESNSPMPRNARRRASCYSMISTDLSGTSEEKTEEEHESPPVATFIHRASMTDERLFNTTEVAHLNKELLKSKIDQKLASLPQESAANLIENEMLNANNEIPLLPTAKSARALRGSVIETIMEDKRIEEKLENVNSIAVSDSGLSSPLTDKSTISQSTSTTAEVIKCTAGESIASEDLKNDIPSNNPSTHGQPHGVAPQLSLVLRDSHSVSKSVFLSTTLFRATRIHWSVVFLR